MDHEAVAVVVHGVDVLGLVVAVAEHVRRPDDTTQGRGRPGGSGRGSVAVGGEDVTGLAERCPLGKEVGSLTDHVSGLLVDGHAELGVLVAEQAVREGATLVLAPAALAFLASADGVGRGHDVRTGLLGEHGQE